MEARADEEDIDGTASWWVVEVVVVKVVVEEVGVELVVEVMVEVVVVVVWWWRRWWKVWSSIPTELCEAEAEVDGGESEGGEAAAVGLQ